MQQQKGFTLVELMIYSVIFASVSLTLVYFLSTFFRVSGYQASSSEVANQANFILGKIQNEIATSTIVVVNDTATSSPTYDEIDDALSQPHAHLVLKTRGETTGDGNDNQSPVLIYKSGANVMLKRGNSAETALNNSSVAVTKLAFTKVSTPPGKDVVLIDLTLQYQSPNAVDRISRDFALGVSRAQAASFDSNVSPAPGASGLSLGSSGSKWASLFLSGGATIDGPLTLTNGGNNTTNNSITFLKQGTAVIGPAQGTTVPIKSGKTVEFYTSISDVLKGVLTGDRVFVTLMPPTESFPPVDPLEDGIEFIGAKAGPDMIIFYLKNTTSNTINVSAHSWSYLVIR